MSWYYAGPEAKPVGPVSLEELQALRATGQITGETYVIEHAGGPGTAIAWRRYREIFPQSVPFPAPPSLPPVPSVVPPILPPPTPAPPHPLFPSAAAGAVRPPPPVYTPTIAPHAAPHGHYPTRVTNACCAWGFGLGLAGFVLAFVCGVGLLLAAPSLILCLVGFAQVQQRREQSGRGLAAAGAALALLGLLISAGELWWILPAGFKQYELSLRQNSE